MTFSHTVAGPFDPRSYWTRFEEPKKAFPELTFGANSITVPQGSTGSREVRMIKYDMRSFMEQCVARYVELCGPKYKATLRSADTPFLDESRPEFDVNPDIIRRSIAFLATRVIHPRRLERVCWVIVLLLC